MTFTSKLEQLEQIHGSLNYNDDISDYPLAQAETHGKVKGSGSDGSVLTASPTQFASLSFTFTAQHVGDFIRIPSGTNAGTYKITGFVDANTVNCALPRLRQNHPYPLRSDNGKTLKMISTIPEPN